MIFAKQKKKNGEAWSDRRKKLAVYACDAFCQMQGIVWHRGGSVRTKLLSWCLMKKTLICLLVQQASVWLLS
jgi:hypothetical protein